MLLLFWGRCWEDVYGDNLLSLSYSWLSRMSNYWESFQGTHMFFHLQTWNWSFIWLYGFNGWVQHTFISYKHKLLIMRSIYEPRKYEFNIFYELDFDLNYNCIRIWSKQRDFGPSMFDLWLWCITIDKWFAIWVLYRNYKVYE